MALHELLAARRADVLSRWKSRVQGTLAPESMPPMELVNHLPRFLGEIVSALRENAGLRPSGLTPDESGTAAGHGEQRLRLGFSLDSVVREYGELYTAILDVALAAGKSPTIPEFRVLFDSIVTGIAHAVSEYSTQRDAELMRGANEHFAFIAHELRNPLGSARMAFELLRARQEVPAQGHAVAALERGLQQASELIDQTLRVARVASGIELRRQTTSLRALVEESEVVAAAEAESRGVNLRVVVGEDRPIELDRRLVRSALGNLLRNAVKYTPSGGTVELRACVSDGRLMLEIEDCCGGLPPGRVEAAFAPFVRLDDRQDGFGLGLAIAKQAVDAHGGSIRVQNLPEKGCIFALEIPVPQP